MTAPQDTTEVKRRAAVAPDRSLVYTSVSAVKKFTTCNAAWFYRYVLRRPDPSGKGAEESTECHARVEHYLKTGENLLGPIELRALKRGLFPAPGRPGPYPHVVKDQDGTERTVNLDILVEWEIDGLLDADGVPFTCKIDCVDPRLVATEGLLIVDDWKFKKGIKPPPAGYGSTPAQLRDPNDPEGEGRQMVGYGEALRRLIAKGWFPGTRTIRLRHVLVEKGHDDAKPVEVDVPVEEFEALWAGQSSIVRAMRAAAQEPEVDLVDGAPLDEKGKRAACWKFGGCAFKAECPHFNGSANRTQRIMALVYTNKGNKMGMLSNMKKAPNPTPAAVVAAPTPPPAAPAPVKTSLIIDESTVPDAVLKANPNVGQPVAAVLPPDAPAPVKTSIITASPAPAVTTATAAPAQAEPTSTGSVDAKPKRGRPTKAEAEAKKAAQAETTVAPPAPATEAATTTGDFYLYVGCSSKKHATKPFSAYVDDLEQKTIAIFKENLKGADGKPLELDDLRLASGNDVGFGKWKAIFGQMAKENPPEPGHYSVLGFEVDDRVSVAVVALESLAADVVTR